VRLINDILDIEKIESGKMKYVMKPVDLATIIDQSIDATRAYGENFKVAFVFETRIAGVQVNGDADRIIQCWRTCCPMRRSSRRPAFP